MYEILRLNDQSVQVNLRKVTIFLILMFNSEFLSKCRDYHNQEYNSTWVCNFMKTTDDCQIEDGFVNYLVFTYCTFELDLIWISLIMIVKI